MVKEIPTNEIFLFTNTLERCYPRHPQRINFINETLAFMDDDFEKAILKNCIPILSPDAKETNKTSFYAKKQSDEIKKFVSKKRMRTFFNIDIKLWKQICKNKSKDSDKKVENENHEAQCQI